MGGYHGDALSPPTRRVLVADDSAVARAALARKLHGLGFDVVEADSAQAVHSVDPSNLACAIFDLDLGEDDGSVTAEALCRSAPGLPVAFFSAGAAADREQRARAIGPVFTKPSQLDQAVAWLDTHAR